MTKQSSMLFRAASCVLAVFVALIIAVAPAYADDDVEPEPEAVSDPPIVVTMGDSYAGGEGNEPYFGQDNTYKYWNQDWVAHRSASCWSTQLVVGGYELSSLRAVPASPSISSVRNKSSVYYNYTSWSEGSWYDVTCSATRIQHINGSASGDGVYSRNVYWTDDAAVGEVNYKASFAPQISVLDYVNATHGEKSCDYIFISTGANDWGIAKLLLTATESSDDPDAVQNKIDYYKNMYNTKYRDAYIDMFWALRKAAGGQAKIVFVGYPVIFDGAVFSLVLKNSDMKLIDGMIEWMDKQLSSLVAELNDFGFENLYYVSLIDAFRGHGAYSADPYIYNIYFGRRSQDTIYSYPFENVSPTSIHPNEKGTGVYVREIQKLIDEIEANEAAELPHEPGWVNEGGAWYYYNWRGELVQNAWVADWGKYYYMGEGGALLTNQWVSFKGKSYFLGADGAMLKNAWYNNNGKYQYFNKNGALTYNSWVSSGGKWYYLGSDAYMLTNSWVKSGGKWYYVDGSGKMLTSSWLSYGGKWYYFNKNGELVTNGWVSSNGKYYYMNGSGNPATNTWVKSGGKYYYLNKNGNPVVNGWVKYQGKYYYMNSNGNPVTNTWITYNGRRYHFNASGVCDYS